MNYGIKNINFDHSSSEVEGTAKVGKIVINFRLHAGSNSWEAWVEGERSATITWDSNRNKALRGARKAYRFYLEPIVEAA